MFTFENCTARSSARKIKASVESALKLELRIDRTTVDLLIHWVEDRRLTAQILIESERLEEERVVLVIGPTSRLRAKAFRIRLEIEKRRRHDLLVHRGAALLVPLQLLNAARVIPRVSLIPTS